MAERSDSRPEGGPTGAIAQLAASAVAMLRTRSELAAVGPILGLSRFARWARLASVGFAVSRIMRSRRGG